MNKIGVIGSGIWGTALALTAVRANNEVLCWARNSDVVDDINLNHKNEKYLPNVDLPLSIKATTDIKDIFDFAKVILLTVSAQHTREIMVNIKPFVKNDTIIVICAKGIEANSGKMLSEVAEEILPNTQIAILSGPGFAIDVAMKRFVSVTIASTDATIAENLTKMLGTPYFRPYMTTDIISPQIGGSIKNVIAIASGIVEGAKFGDGARAALITRGFHEMSKLSKGLGGELTTMMGMCGLGDLVMTASCMQSRNFSFGYDVGVKGDASSVIKENTKTVEGLFTTKAVVKRALELEIEMPICEMINRLLFEGVSLKDAMNELLCRPYKGEGI